MAEIIDPATWEDNQDFSNPDTPSFRFSRYFAETCDRAVEKIAGEWLKILDYDTLKDFCETLLTIDNMANKNSLNEDNSTRKDLNDLLYLTLLIWQWEKGTKIDIETMIEDDYHLNVEYLFRLARLIQFEFFKRNGEGKEAFEILSQDDAQYHGKLSIFD